MERGGAPDVVSGRQLRKAVRESLRKSLKLKAPSIVANRRHGTDRGDAAGYPSRIQKNRQSTQLSALPRVSPYVPDEAKLSRCGGRARSFPPSLRLGCRRQPPPRAKARWAPSENRPLRAVFFQAASDFTTSACCRGNAGNMTDTTSPPGCRLRASITPECNATARAAIASPRPSPPPARSRAASTR